MSKPDWMEEFPGAITVTDIRGRIIFLNRQATLVFEQQGGSSLLGQNIKDCHRPDSWEKIRQILENGKPNVYTIEKQGQKKNNLPGCLDQRGGDKGAGGNQP